jgi:hypothetical protein
VWGVAPWASDPCVVFWRLLRAAMHTLFGSYKGSRCGSGRSFARMPLSVRMRGDRGVAVVMLFDQGGGLIVRPVKMRHGPDMGSRFLVA